MNTQRMPGIAAVARAQLELLWHIKYVAGLLGFLMLVVLIIYGLLSPDSLPLPPWEAPALSFFYVQLIGTGGVAGALVWFSEGPTNRRYHWSMPVKREIHDVMRVAAGAFWLMLMMAFFCVVAWFAEGPVSREQWLGDANLYWAALFLVPLLTYLLVAVPCMILGRPLLAILVLLTVGVLSTLQPVADRIPLLGDLGLALISDKHPPSLGVAIAGGAVTAAPWAEAVHKQRVYRATSEAFFKAHPELPRSAKQIADREMSAPVLESRAITTRDWLWSLFVWYTIALLGVAFAARRRPDV